MFFTNRPPSFSPDEIATIEANLARVLTAQLGHDFRDVRVVEDVHDQASIAVQCETSAEDYDRREAHIILTIAREVAALYQNYPALQRLVTRIDIWDDKVALSDKWFDRADVLAWHEQLIDDHTFLERGTSYW
jgi:hypothetical protein